MTTHNAQAISNMDEDARNSENFDSYSPNMEHITQHPVETPTGGSGILDNFVPFPADKMRIKGAYAHNLKIDNLVIPKNQIVVFTGISGSGKSSLVFETIAKEGKRRLLDTFSAFSRSRLPKITKPDVEEIDNLCTAIVIDQVQPGNKNTHSTVGTFTEVLTFIRLLISRAGIDKEGNPNLTLPSFAFSFNHPMGQCAACHGSGIELFVNVDRFVDREKSFKDGAVSLAFYQPDNYFYGQFCQKHGLFDVTKKIKDLTPEEYDNMFNKETKAKVGKKTIRIEGIVHRIKRLGLSGPQGTGAPHDSFGSRVCAVCNGTRLNDNAKNYTFCGKTLHDMCAMELEELYEFVRTTLEEHRETEKVVKEENSEISENSENRIPNTAVPILERLLVSLRPLSLLVPYLTLERRSSTLSGGELQRIKLARNTDIGLTGIMYVLDEPLSQLSQYDCELVIDMIALLKKKGNTVYVVEHNPSILRVADHIVDIGPGSSDAGGEVVLNESIDSFKTRIEILKQAIRNNNKDVINAERSVTAVSFARMALLHEQGSAAPSQTKVKIEEIEDEKKSSKSKKSDIDLDLDMDSDDLVMSSTDDDGIEEIESAETFSHSKKNRRITTNSYTLTDCALHNLKHFDISMPLSGVMVGVVGASGSGKSTLVHQCMVPRMKDDTKFMEKYQIFQLSQRLPGKNSRSNSATYLGIFDKIRALFAKATKKVPGFFSYNSVGVKGGACPKCKGKGALKVEMAFLDSVSIPCEDCEGKRFKKEVFRHRYKNKTIHDILCMTIAEAETFFRGNAYIHCRLQAANEVGIGYLTLGQTLSTLSGGERLRLNVSTILHAASNDNNHSDKHKIFVIDEASQGLHVNDVHRLGRVLLNIARNPRSTVFIIEHNLQMVSYCDYVVELGPGGGKKGGEILCGPCTPETLVDNKRSVIGQYLREHL